METHLKKIETEICVIGGGPAGMTAAIEAADVGSKVLLIDERRKLGGQIFRQFPNEFLINEKSLQKNSLDKEYHSGKNLINELKRYQDRITVLSDAFVWGIFPGKEIALIKNQKSLTVICQKLILAEGVYERPLPFPGWTLPGVFSAGGTQNILKNQRVLPGRRFLLSGTGPLQLVLAHQLINSGAEVVAVLEASTHIQLKQMLSLFKQLKLVKDGIKYLNTLRREKVPFIRGHTIVKAHGEKGVTGATYVKLDQNWKPIGNTEVDVEVDTICLGFGFISSTRLSRLCECEHRYDSLLNCWVPVHDENMETSVNGIFVAGDCAGVAGHLVAVEEGRIAGIRAAQKLGYIDSKSADSKIGRNAKKRKKMRVFQTAVNEISSIRPGLYYRITDDTIVCRCEELTAGEIKANLPNNSSDLNELKRVTRFGMGNCQGRFCESIVSQMMAMETNIPIEKLIPLRYRPPIKPISLSTFLAE